MNYLLKKHIAKIFFLITFNSILFAEDRLYLKNAGILENKTIGDESVKYLSDNVIFKYFLV